MPVQADTRTDRQAAISRGGNILIGLFHVLNYLCDTQILSDTEAHVQDSKGASMVQVGSIYVHKNIDRSKEQWHAL